jgi:patatin-related protein
LALILNGGVSLAVWIGGVTQEIDQLRRANAAASVEDTDATATRPLYAKLLDVVKEDVVVDVIGGASAGGINGALLGAAIYNKQRLEGLRDIWITLGDFRRLLRRAKDPASASLFKGDDVVLPELRRELNRLYLRRSTAPEFDAGNQLHVFLPATDIQGIPARFADSTGREFFERDHRRVFHFTSVREEAGDDAVDGAAEKDIFLGDPAAPELLARAARSSSSFPVAFEAHELKWRDEGKVTDRWLVDGGILDNQPFAPVLDKLAVLPADSQQRRVVMYIVPYVTERSKTDRSRLETATPATPIGTIGAALNLPRDLPKLNGLERITRERGTVRRASETARVIRSIPPREVSGFAKAAFDAYRDLRYSLSIALFRLWAAQAHDAPGEDTSRLRRLAEAEAVRLARRDCAWIPPQQTWTAGSGPWAWGIDPAQRVAAWMLLTLREAQFPGAEELHDDARRTAAALVATIQAARRDLKRAFTERVRTSEGLDVYELATATYEDATVERIRQEIQDEFTLLDEMSKRLNATLGPVVARSTASGSFWSRLVGRVEREPSRPQMDVFRAATVQESLDIEVVRFSFGVRDPEIQPPFQFLMASAGVKNSLGHGSSTPETKLAGMKLNHFGGFLKRSWRANDWLWGRLDGVEHLTRALLTPGRLIELEHVGVASSSAAETLNPPALSKYQQLAQLAFAREPGAPESDPDRNALRDLWRQTRQSVDVDRWGAAEPIIVDGKVVASEEEAQFAAVLDATESDRPGSDESEAALAACRGIIAARFQLRILATELSRVAETAIDDLHAGAAQSADGAMWARTVRPDADGPTRLRLFKQMRIGEESLTDEASSRYTADVAAQTMAVAASMMAGPRGGLSAGGRAVFGSARNVTLAASYAIRLFARLPSLGVVVLATLIAMITYAIASKAAVLGATLPVLVIAAAALTFTIINVSVSSFQYLYSWGRIGWFFATLVVTAAYAAVVLKADAYGGPGEARIDRWATRIDSRLNAWCGERAVTLSGYLALAGAGALLLCGVIVLAVRVVEAVGHSSAPRRAARPVTAILLWAYRLLVVATLTVLVVGFVLERINAEAAATDTKPTGWSGLADEHAGALLVLLLLAVLVAAGILTEIIPTGLGQYVKRFRYWLARLVGRAYASAKSVFS